MTVQAARMLVDEILPRIQSAVPRCVKAVGAEDGEELIADVTAMAAEGIESCEERGVPLHPGSICYYAIQRAKTGRRSYGAGRMDAMSPAAQLDGRSALASMDEGIPADGDGGEATTLHDVLGSDAEDPSQAAARKIDWAALVANLDARKLGILKAFADGGKLQALARKFRVSAPRITQLKAELARQIKEAWGDGAIADAVRAPSWRAGIAAGRERSLCRHERAILADA